MISTSVAILADIHGNVEAFDAVLSDLQHHKVEHIILAGDLVMNGPRPAETMQRIHALQMRSVIGNTDIETLQATDPVGYWARQQLGDNDIDFLRLAPLTYRISPSKNCIAEDDLLITHSTPRDCFDLLILKPHPLGTTFKQATSLADARLMLKGQQANTIVFGHIHYFSEALIDNQPIRSIGSVGFPFDGDRRAAYTIARWNTDTWEFENYRVSYNYERVAQDLEHTNIPFAPRYARMIREANWFPRSEK